MILLVVFLILTTPQGKDIYVNPDAVAAVTYPFGCAPDSHADIILMSGGHVCVAEDVHDVRRKLEDKK